MTQSIKISVIIPAYNASRYLRDALESVLAQTETDWELIAVNDGSTDSTGEILNAYSRIEGKIRVIHNPVASGTPFRARLSAFETARGDYIVALDADDRIDKNYLKELLELSKSADADITCGMMVDYDSPEKYHTPWQSEHIGEVREGRDCVALTLDGWKIGMNGALIKRSLMSETLHDFSYHDNGAYSDEMLSRLLLLKARRVAFGKSRYHYRRNEDSVTHKISTVKFGNLINNISLIELMEREYGDDSEEYILAHRQNFHGVFDAMRVLNLNKLDHSGRKSVLQMIEAARIRVNYRKLKGRVSGKYKMLMRLPVHLSLPLLSFTDRFLSKR